MDIIFINALRVDTIIGIHPWERETPQPVILDLELGTDISISAKSKNVQDTLDYQAITLGLERLISTSQHHLLETLAEHCINYLRHEFGVPWIRLRLTKPQALDNACGAGVYIERGERR